MTAAGIVLASGHKLTWISESSVARAKRAITLSRDCMGWMRQIRGNGIVGTFTERLHGSVYV